MNQKLYSLERTRLIRQNVPFPIATEIAYAYVKAEEQKEKALFIKGKV